MWFALMFTSIVGTGRLVCEMHSEHLAELLATLALLPEYALLVWVKTSMNT
jgi:hypothetical protein